MRLHYRVGDIVRLYTPAKYATVINVRRQGSNPQIITVQYATPVYGALCHISGVPEYVTTFDLSNPFWAEKVKAIDPKTESTLIEDSGITPNGAPLDESQAFLNQLISSRKTASSKTRESQIPPQPISLDSKL